MTVTHAITLWPEWAFAIAHLGKDIENRSWTPAYEVIGTRIAIHAGANVGGRPGKTARQEGVSALGYTAERAGLEVRAGHDPDDPSEVVFMAHNYARRIQRRAIVATAVVTDYVTVSDSDWFAPRDTLAEPTVQAAKTYGWVLADVHTLVEPVPVPKGKLGLWPLSPELQLSIQHANVQDPRSSHDSH